MALSFWVLPSSLQNRPQAWRAKMPRHSDTASDEDDMEEEEEEVTTTSAGRVYKHVLPRIDPDSYQCSVPDGLLVQSASEAAGT